MSQKVAIVTGGTRGIGFAIVQRLASDGYKVRFTGRSRESVDRAHAKLDVTAQGSVCDISDEGSVNAFFEEAIKAEGRIDVLVNNAGITRDGLFLRMKPDQWDEVMNTNLRGVYLCCKAVARPMMKNEEGGRIIILSSVVGVGGNAGQANYAAAKAGVLGLTKSLAKELGSRNILVNAIAPGFIETDMTAELGEQVKETVERSVPLSRTGRAEEVAALCSFLAGPDSSYITGQTIHVDGGMLMG
ncbi:MAG: 3-oxoacyl-[acyl-carrier-protein] reductase [Candidatus Omnitrophica bacterium]|nr:3-oxoacyl-[acyl-carrier-protein] reductase [Candidatus Omnitrophota bacterium]